MAEEEPKAPAKKGSFLSKKFHGVPMPVVVIGGGVGLYLVYNWYKNRQASSTSSTAATTPSTTPTTTTDTTGSGPGGGGSTLGGGGGAIDPLTGLPYAPGVGSLAPPSSTSVPGTAPGTPIGTVPASGAYTGPGGIVVNPGGGTDQAAVDALNTAIAARAKALKSGNATAIKDATANVKRAQAVVAERNKAASQALGNTLLTSAIPGGGQVDPITYSSQVAESGSGTGKSAPTGLKALTGSNGNAGAVAPKTQGVVTNAAGGTDQAAVDALNKAEAARQEAIKSGNKTALANATAGVKRAQAIVSSRNRAAK